MYERILNDEFIKDIFNKLGIEEQKEEAFLAYHSERHIMNVVYMVVDILRQLDYDSDFVEKASIAAILHDIGMIYGKKDHALNSYNMAKEYFEQNNIDIADKEIILDAILHHSDGFGRNNPIAAALMFADKIDIKKDRVAPKGYDIVGMRQLQYIDDIKIKIDKLNKELVIDFIVDAKADKKELEEYYFIDKVFKAINSFAKENSLEERVFYNGDAWSLNK